LVEQKVITKQADDVVAFDNVSRESANGCCKLLSTVSFDDDDCCCAKDFVVIENVRVVAADNSLSTDIIRIILFACSYDCSEISIVQQYGRSVELVLLSLFLSILESVGRFVPVFDVFVVAAVVVGVISILLLLASSDVFVSCPTVVLLSFIVSFCCFFFPLNQL
jgi:uncharacterized membrane protein